MDKDNFVVKANKLIEAKGRLSVIEQKLLATLISEIKIEDEDFKNYRLKIKEMGEFINLNSNAVYEQLKLASRSLQNKEIVIENIDKNGKKDFLVTRMLSSARYKEGDGYLDVLIDPNLKPYLVAINGKNTPFTKYIIKNILKLSGSYSIRLYELLKQYERVKERDFEIGELKELLGVDELNYNRFDNFERRVLTPAKNEINRNTDINIDYEKIKTGRKITNILFKIEPKKHKKEIFTNDINSLRSSMGFQEDYFNDNQILCIYEKAVEKAGNEDIDIFEYIRLNYIHIKDKARNKYAYLIKALENDYAVAIAQIRLDYYIEE